MFLEDSFIFFCVRILINIIGNESGDKSNVTYNWDPQKGVGKAADSQKRGPHSKKFGKLWHIGLFEGESLPRSARQIDQVGVNEQDNNMMEEISIVKIRKSISAWKKRLSLVVGEDGDHDEHRLK